MSDKKKLNFTIKSKSPTFKASTKSSIQQKDTKNSQLPKGQSVSSPQKPIVKPILSEAEKKKKMDLLNQGFDQFKANAEFLIDHNVDKMEMINYLLKYYQLFQTIMQKSDNNNQTIGNFNNSVIENKNNNTYEINNDITLLNFGDTRISSVVQLFSDMNFINHIIRKDQFLNKYTVIVYDTKWDNNNPTPISVPGGEMGITNPPNQNSINNNANILNINNNSKNTSDNKSDNKSNNSNNNSNNKSNNSNNKSNDTLDNNERKPILNRKPERELNSFARRNGLELLEGLNHTLTF